MANPIRLIEQAAEILREEKKAMHVNDIAQKLVEKYPNIQIPLDKLPDKITTVLSSDIRRRGGKSIFSRSKNKTGGNRKGTYRIKGTRSKIPKDFAVPEQPKVTNDYTGKAGENAVVSELLFFGFNASLMAVDEGIDVVASKDNKYFHIQVKTANISKSGNYGFTIKKKAFDTNSSSSTFYILVIRNFETGRYINDFIVLPVSEIRRLVDNKVINSADTYSLRIEKNRGGQYLLNSIEPVTRLLNRFDIIA